MTTATAIATTTTTTTMMTSTTTATYSAAALIVDHSIGTWMATTLSIWKMTYFLDHHSFKTCML